MTDVSEHTAEVTPTVATYPSRRIRPIPSFAFTAPPGWIVEDAPDALAVVRTPAEVDGFWVNALLAHDRVPKGVTLEEAAKFSAAKMLEASPEAEIHLERVALFGDLVMYLRAVELDAPSSDRKLGQLHAIFVAPEVEGANTADLFQFIGTADADSMERIGPIFATMFGTFRFT